MTFHEIRSIYPNILELYASVAGQVESNTPWETVMTFTGIRINVEIDRRHRREIWDRLAGWARVVEANNAYLAENGNPEPKEAYTVVELEPGTCAVCGSNERSGAVCRWCHSKTMKGRYR